MNAPALIIEVPAHTGDDAVMVRFVCPDGSVHEARAGDLMQEYSDMFKDIHGIRPRWERHTSATIGRAMENLCYEYEQHMVAEKAREQAAIAEMEATITKTIALGAGNRKTAIRWLMQADDTNNFEEFEYLNNIPYGYFGKK